MTSHCFKTGGSVSSLQTTGIAQDQAGTQGHEGRIDVAAEIYVLEEMDPVFIAQYAPATNGRPFRCQWR